MLKVDIGGGNNPHKDCNVVVDRADFAYFYRDEDTRFIRYDILEGLPFADNSVDWIYCHHVLEHLPHLHPYWNPARAMDALIYVLNEFHRVLKVGCEAYIVVPWKGHTNAWRHPTHYRFFDENFFGWFSHTNLTPDHAAEGYEGKFKLIKNEIIDGCHVLAILRKVE